MFLFFFFIFCQTELSILDVIFEQFLGKLSKSTLFIYRTRIVYMASNDATWLVYMQPQQIGLNFAKLFNSHITLLQF